MFVQDASVGRNVSGRCLANVITLWRFHTEVVHWRVSWNRKLGMVFGQGNILGRSFGIALGRMYPTWCLTGRKGCRHESL